MADFLKNIIGGDKSPEAAVPKGDAGMFRWFLCYSLPYYVLGA